MIVLEDVVAAALLSLVVLGDSAPSDNGLFVTPGGMRQDPSWPARALEPFVVDEPVNALEDRPQVFCEGEVKIELFYRGMDFENDREHLQHPNLSKIARGKGDASCRNLRAGARPKARQAYPASLA
jgi:hypothetical protein